MVITQCVFRISISGIFMMSADRTVKSASLPISIEPRSASSKAAYAGQTVNILSACSRVTASSGCQPSPEKPFKSFRSVVEDDQAVPGIAARSPKKKRLMTAQRRWQPVTAAKKIDSPCLPVVLGEDSAACPFLRRELKVSLIDGGHYLFPSKLIGVMLWEGCTHVAVLAARDFER